MLARHCFRDSLNDSSQKLFLLGALLYDKFRDRFYDDGSIIKKNALNGKLQGVESTPVTFGKMGLVSFVHFAEGKII